MKPFVVNRHGRLVFPANFLGELDFSVLDTLDQFTAVIGRDFEAKAPTGTDILARVESGAYPGRFELLRDLGQNLYWVNRYAITMFDQRPTRWRDLAKRRDDVFLPVLTPWEDSERKVAAVEQRLPGAAGHVGRRDRGQRLRPAVRPVPHQAAPRHGAAGRSSRRWPSSWPARRADVRDARLRPRLPGLQDRGHPRRPRGVPELEALMRWAMVLHNQYPWDRSRTELRGPARDRRRRLRGRLPSAQPGRDGVHRAGEALGRTRPARDAARPRAEAVEPVAPYPPVRVREAFAVQPKLEALAIVRGEHVCSNADVIRNASFSWSPMSADEIAAKTGIEQRRYTSREPEQLALHAARAALAKSGRDPAEIGAVLVSTCTSNRLIPSMACWLSGELGLQQTHASADLVAACAGLPYGLAEAIRQLQEVRRPVLLVCVEKFSDKIGSVRTSRMIFGDGAAAMVIGPAAAGEPGTWRWCRPTPAGRTARSTRSSGRTRSSTTTSPCTVRRSSRWCSATWPRCSTNSASSRIPTTPGGRCSRASS